MLSHHQTQFVKSQNFLLVLFFIRIKIFKLYQVRYLHNKTVFSSQCYESRLENRTMVQQKCNFDSNNILVITTSNIVRCRSCRSYINPFVSFIDVSRWKCNLCGRVNEVPEEFKSNPINKGMSDFKDSAFS